MERKAYTPEWMAWLVTILMVTIIIFSVYLVFAMPPEPGELPPYATLALVVPVAIGTYDAPGLRHRGGVRHHR